VVAMVVVSEPAEEPELVAEKEEDPSSIGEQQQPSPRWSRQQ